MAKTGREMKCFYKEGGMDAAGEWAELDSIQDLTLNVEKAEADASTRGTGGWKATLLGLKDGSVEGKLVWDPEDDGFGAVHDAFFNDHLIGLAILDGPIASGTGLMGNFAVTKFSRSEPLEEAVTVDVAFKPGYSPAAPPRWLEAGASPTGSDTY